MHFVPCCITLTEFPDMPTSQEELLWKSCPGCGTKQLEAHNGSVLEFSPNKVGVFTSRLTCKVCGWRLIKCPEGTVVTT